MRIIKLATLVTFTICFVLTQIIYAQDVSEETVLRPKIVPIGSVDYQRVKSYFDKIKSKNGTIGYLANRKSVMVYDSQEVVDKVIKYAGRYLKNSTLQMGLTFEYLEVAGCKVENEVFDPSWKVKVDGDKVKIPVVEGFDVTPYALSYANKIIKKKTIFPGKTLTIAKGTPRKDYEQFWDFLVDPETVLLRDEKVFKFTKKVYPDKMTSYLKLTSRFSKNSGRVELEIFPVLEMEIEGKSYFLKVASLATRSRLRLNRKLAVGVLMHTRYKGYQELFGIDFFEEKSRISIYDLCISTSINR